MRLRVGLRNLRQVGSGTVNWPQNSGGANLPVITGSLNVGSTLTCSTGTWSNTPTGYAYQWYEAGSPVGTNANTYVSTIVGASIYCVVTASNANGSGSAQAAAVGPITGAGLATPTLSIVSTLGASPLVLGLTTTDYTAGLYGQLQIDQTSNAFSNITQNIVFLIDGASWSLNDESIGLITPSGTYWARERTCRDNESGATTVSGTDPSGASVSFLADVSSWSNTVTDTISSFSAVFSATATNSNVVRTNSNKTMTTNDFGSNASQSDRINTPLSNPTGYIEFTLSSATNISTGPPSVGIIDSALTLSGSFVDLYSYSRGAALFANGDGYKGGVYQSSITALTAGQTIAIVAHLATKTIWFRGPSGWLNGTPAFNSDGTIGAGSTGGWVLSSLVDVYPAGCGQRADTWVENAGQSAFVYTPPTNCKLGWA
jgi:hypothetical protein